jgi:hypothetical protein
MIGGGGGGGKYRVYILEEKTLRMDLNLLLSTADP